LRKQNPVPIDVSASLWDRVLLLFTTKRSGITLFMHIFPEQERCTAQVRVVLFAATVVGGLYRYDLSVYLESLY